MPFQIRDLFFSIRDLFFGIRNLLFTFADLLFALGNFTTEFFVLSSQPLILTFELFPAGRRGMSMAIRRGCELLSGVSRSRTHPPYSKRFGRICPAKSAKIFPSHPPELRDEPMAMIPFMQRFPEVGARETRCVTVPQRQSLPQGDYGFVEFYCDEPDCDCRRVMIDVLRPETGGSKVWATISYGWESLDFYRQWDGGGSDPVQIKGPYLDPLNPQTKYSSALLDLFRFLIQSPEYVARLPTALSDVPRVRRRSRQPQR